MNKLILKRRELLTALGAASFLAAPVFRETLAQAQASSAPLRFVVLMFPGGVYYPPGSTGRGNFTFEKSLAPFVPLQSEVLFLDNASNDTQSGINNSRNDPHGGGMLSLLTGADGGTSIDQMLAPKLSAGVKFSSLQFGVYTAAEGAGGRTINFNNGAAIQPVDEPQVMFDRLFAGGAPTTAPPAATGTMAPPPPMMMANTQLRKSLLDHLMGEIQAIKLVAGAREQAKLDQHLTSLRELEKQIPTTMTGGSIPGGGGTVPFNPSVGCAAPTIEMASEDIPKLLGQQMDLLYSALACDLTRVASLQILRSGQATVRYPWINVPDEHHGLEHGQEDAIYGERLDAVQNYFFAQLSTLVNRMKNTPEGNGSMLDNSLVLLCSELGNAGQHSCEPMTWCTIGRAQGLVRPGRNIDYAGVHSANALLSIANALDPSITRVGESGKEGATLQSLT